MRGTRTRPGRRRSAHGAATGEAAPRPAVRARTAFWLVAGAFAVTMLGTTLPTPLYVLYQQKLGFSTPLIAVIFAVYATGVLTALVLFGRASDQFGRRRLLLAGLACSALAAAVFLLAQSLPLLFIGRVLSGLSAGVFTGTATATLVDLASSGHSQRASVVASTANMAGLGLGPLLAGMLAQFAPLPLRLPYWVDLVLVLIAIGAVSVIPETVSVPPRARLRISRPDLPAELRSTFAPAATAGFAGFAVLGLLTAVAPSFLAGVLHQPSHALSGAVVCSAFAASTIAQIALAPRLGRWALPAGCLGLLTGMGLLAGGLAGSSLPLVIAAAIVAGMGQGLSFRAGLQAINDKAPAARRAGVASSFFIVLYVAISLPVIGEGFASSRLGLQTAGIAFSVAVAALASGALMAVLPRRGRATHASAPARA